MDKVLLILQKTIRGIGKISGDLFAALCILVDAFDCRVVGLIIDVNVQFRNAPMFGLRKRASMKSCMKK